MKFVNINLLAKSMEGNNACYFWLICLKETHIYDKETLKTGQIWPEENRRVKKSDTKHT